MHPLPYTILSSFPFALEFFTIFSFVSFAVLICNQPVKE